MEHGYPPSVREICAEVGLRSTSTVHAHLKKLQEAGYLEASDHKSRALAPVSGASMVPRVPILGRVTAGMPILSRHRFHGARKRGIQGRRKHGHYHLG